MKSDFGKFAFVLTLIKIQFFCIDAREFEFGPCFLSFLEPCANNSIQFYLYNGNDNDSEPVLLDNISPILPTDYNATITQKFKLIIHGYGGHTDVNGFKSIRNGKKVQFNSKKLRKKKPQMVLQIFLYAQKPAFYVAKHLSWLLRHTAA